MANFKIHSIDNTFTYFSNYLYNLGKGIFRKHSPELDLSTPNFNTKFTLSHQSCAQWNNFFNTNKCARIPYTFQIPSSSQVIIEYCGQLGLSYKNLMFASSRIDFFRDSTEPGERRLSYNYLGAEKMGPANSILKFSTSVCNTANINLFKQTDYFLLKQTRSINSTPDKTVSTIRYMRKQKTYLHHEIDKVSTIYVKKSTGKKFGLLSGDLNLTHILNFSAKLLFKSKPFIQGLCTLNFVINQISRRYPNQILSLQIFYSKPVIEGQLLTLLCDGERFELVNREYELLAFGEITLNKSY